jgi:hypothetical protein
MEVRYGVEAGLDDSPIGFLGDMPNPAVVQAKLSPEGASRNPAEPEFLVAAFAAMTGRR